MYAVTDEDLVRTYTPSNNPRLRVLVEDMGRMLCHVTNCPNADALLGTGDPCGHKRLAAQFVRATADHYISELLKVGDVEASEILRDEV